MRFYLFSFCFLFVARFGFASSFVGYPLWQTAEPKIRIETDNLSKILPIEVSVFLDCEGAETYKISNNKNFKNAVWKKVVPELKWFLEEKDFATVYVIFRRTHPDKDTKEISPVVHYTIDRKNIYKKIVRLKHGYVDWTDFKIVAQEIYSNKNESNVRYFFKPLQIQAEKNINSYLYAIFKNLALNSYYKIKDLLLLHETFDQNILKYINKERKLFEISYLSKESIRLSGKVAIYSENDGLIDFLKPKIGRENPPQKDFFETKIDHLVIDVRNLNFKLCLFPEVISESEEILIHHRHHKKLSQSYVSYLRTLDGLERYLKKNNDPKKGQTLIIKPLALKTGEESKIIVTKRYYDLIAGNRKNISKIANGGFLILTD